MEKGRKREDSAGDNIEACKHETQPRKNAVLVELASHDTLRPNRIEDKEKLGSIYRRIREILESARSGAYRAVNFAMVQAYWQIGRVIVEEEQGGKAKAEYWVKKLGENENRIVEIVVTNKFVTIPELSKMLKISTTAVENNIAKLKAKKILKRIGPDKGGYWEVVKK
jgi:ATP-dependent DNA helicase RecG